MARLTAMGFLATGLIGFFVKLIFIPINQVRGGRWGCCVWCCMSLACRSRLLERTAGSQLGTPPAALP